MHANRTSIWPGCAIQFDTNPEHAAPPKFGGLPAGVREENFPVSENTHQLLHLLLEVPLAKVELAQRPDIDRLLIITNLNSDSYWSPMYYRDLGDRVELISEAKGENYGEFPRIFEERAAYIESLAEPDDWDADEWPPGPLHRLGGIPGWVQNEEYPTCVQCKREMQFAAQIDSDESVGIMFGDLGILYAFICEDCKITATFMQCH